ncbi:MAG: hypothetical protein IT289_11395 [Oligoflexia bacterium]|nr:hypothetical protein [Oligoflexia bacterium]
MSNTQYSTQDLRSGADPSFQKKLAELLRRESRLSIPDPLYAEGLLFDKSLYNISRLYRQNRVLAHVLGARLVPKFITVGRSLEEFDLKNHEIYYNPIADELLWRLSTKNSDEWIWTMRMVLEYSNSIFHELSHFIINKSLPWVECGLERYAFQESLVLYRDVLLGRELGKGGLPFNVCGVVYRTSADTGPLAKSKRFDFFRTQVIFGYLQVRGIDNARGRSLLLKNGVKLGRFTPLDLNPMFSKTAYTTWMKARAMQSVLAFKPSEIIPLCDVHFLKKVFNSLESIFQTSTRNRASVEPRLRH